MSLLKLFRKNKDGVTAIEFAILAPVFFLLFMGIIEVGLTMFVDSSLNTAVREISRKGISQELSSSDANDIMNKHLAGLYDPAKIEIVNPETDPSSPTRELNELRALSKEFRDDQASFFANNGYESNNRSGRIVVYAARYEWGGFSKLVAPFLPEYLYSVSVVRTEEYK